MVTQSGQLCSLCPLQLLRQSSFPNSLSSLPAFLSEGFNNRPPGIYKYVSPNSKSGSVVLELKITLCNAVSVPLVHIKSVSLYSIYRVREVKIPKSGYSSKFFSLTGHEISWGGDSVCAGLAPFGLHWNSWIA